MSTVRTPVVSQECAHHPVWLKSEWRNPLQQLLVPKQTPSISDAARILLLEMLNLVGFRVGILKLLIFELLVD